MKELQLKINKLEKKHDVESEKREIVQYSWGYVAVKNQDINADEVEIAHYISFSEEVSQAVEMGKETILKPTLFETQYKVGFNETN